MPGIYRFGKVIILGGVGAQPSSAGSAIPAALAPSISLTWSPASFGPTTVGYKVYWGDVRSGNYPNSFDVGNTTNFVIGSLVNGHTYYITVKAYDALGNESQGAYEQVVMMPQLGNFRYVSTTGNDTNTGTSVLTPWRTIGKALTSAPAGCTVYVRGGTYNEKFSTTVAGTAANNKICIRPYDLGGTPEAVTIGCSAVSFASFEPHMNFSQSSYLLFRGFTIDGSAYSGTTGPYNEVYAGSNRSFHHLEFANNIITNGALAAFFFEPPNNATTNCCTSIISNTAFNNGNGGITIYQGDGGGSNSSCGYYRIFNNVIHNNTPGGTTAGAGANFDGVQVGSMGGGNHHIVVKDNNIYQEGNANGADVLDLGGHSVNHHYLVEDNYIHDPTGFGHFKCHSGDQFASTGSTYTVGISGFHVVRRNVFKSLLWDMYGTPDPVGAYNNTWFDCTLISQQTNSTSGGTSPVSYGDSSYSSWLTSSGQSDTDTGRLIRKNDLIFQNSAYSGVLYANYINPLPIIDCRPASEKFYNNTIRPTTGMTFSWYSPGGSSTQINPAVSASGLITLQTASQPGELGSAIISDTVSQCFFDTTNADYRLKSTSSARNRGFAISTALNAGVSSTSLTVDRASLFHDGFPSPVYGDRMNEPDSISIGGRAAVQISSINPVTNVITLASPATWNIGDSVTLAGLKDAGAFQWVADTVPYRPQNLTILTVTPS